MSVELTLDFSSFSGCELQNIIEDIGYDQITLLGDRDELIGQYHDADIIDEITNNNKRDHGMIIKELFESNIILGSENHEEILNRLEQLLLDAGL